MPKFRYTAVDREGTPVSGELQAASVEAALAQLTARNLQIDAADLVELEPRPLGAGSRLSKEEAAELIDQVSELAKAGLPLAPGLRAMAAEMGRGRLGMMLGRMADRLETGASLEAALTAEGDRFPAHLRCLIMAGVENGRLPEVLAQLVDQHRDRLELRGRVWTVLAYPTVLLGLMLALYVFFSIAIVPGVVSVFGDVERALTTGIQMLVWLAGPGMKVVLGLVVLLVVGAVATATLPGPAWMRRVFYGIPLVGPLWRFSRLADFSRWMALLLDHGLPLPVALRVAGEAVQSPEFRTASRLTAERVEAGCPLDEAVARQWQFPPNLTPLLGWGQKASAMAEAFRAAAELFQRGAASHLALVESVLPPMIFLAVAGVLLTMIAGMLLPLLFLIRRLLWWFLEPGAVTDPSGVSILAGVAGLLLLGIAVLLAQRVVSATWEPASTDFLNLLLRVIGWVLITSALIVFSAALMGVFVLVFWIAAAAVAMMVAHRRRRTRQYVLLSAMAVAAERQIPLLPVIEALAENERDRPGYRTARLANLLRSGSPLPAALWECRGAISREALSTIRVGYESGALAPALRRAVDDHGLNQPTWDALAGRMVYLCLVSGFACIMMLWMMLTIVPSLQTLFDDYGLDLPAPTQFLAVASSRVADSAFLLVPLGFGLFLGAILLALLHHGGLVRWGVPGLDGLLGRRDSANILDTLALVARHGRPIAEGMASLAVAYPHPPVRRRLREAAIDVARGEDWCGSLFRRGLVGQAEMAVLQAAQRVGNLPWALEEMARSVRRRFLYRARLLLQVLYSMVLLILGLLTMLIVVSYFLPLIKLIEFLSRV